MNRKSQEVSAMRVAAYAAPTAGGYYFYIPMWSILPGIYAKYFGLSLTTIAAVVLFIRLFDGVIDTTIGYLSDWHRAAGGSRKSWVVVGSLGVIVACYFLFQPSQPATTSYYLMWSMVYFLAFTIADIPHCTWGSELTLNYQQRARIFAVRYFMTRMGIVAFYAIPLLPFYATTDYTPQVLKDAAYAGGILTLIGLAWMMIAAPPGIVTRTVREDSPRLFIDSLLRNKPLLLYFGAYSAIGISAGMWFGLLYFYLDTYLGLGAKVALMFLLATAIAAVSTPLWVKAIHKTSKSTVWTIGILLFIAQMIGTLLIGPGDSWWLAFLLVIIANIFFTCNDVASMSMLGDIIDYGKLKFHKDRGATYFGFNTLLFKVGLGVGGGISIGIAGLFGFDPAGAVHTDASILGLKLGFVFLPLVFAAISMVFIIRTPITPRRHRIIQRRLQGRE